MTKKNYPDHYQSLIDRFPNAMKALESLGTSLRTEGPLDQKTSHLIQLAASAVSQSEGAVHSHARRALEKGASPDEMYHAVMLLVSTVGFPKVAAAISWIDDVLKKD